MSAPSWADLEALFHEALARAPADRAALLAERCAGRPDLLAEVEVLLGAHDGAAIAEGFMNAPAAEMAARTIDAGEGRPPLTGQLEAASPALIEKARSVVTDSQGLYQIVDLRPGAYTVTFTLPGFSTLRREGLELTTGFTATG